MLLLLQLLLLLLKRHAGDGFHGSHAENVGVARPRIALFDVDGFDGLKILVKDELTELASVARGPRGAFEGVVVVRRTLVFVQTRGEQQATRRWDVGIFGI